MKKKVSRFIFLFIFPVLCFVLTGFFAVTTFSAGYAFALSGNGGAIYVSTNATYNMGANTKISGIKANNGGGIYNVGTFRMRGSSEISNCMALDSGGGVYNEGTAIIAGVIQNNSAPYGSNIFNSGDMTIMSGAKVGTAPKSTTTKPYTRVDASGVSNSSGDYVIFGSWPQTIKASNVTIDETNVDERGFFLGSDGYRYAKSDTYPTCPSFSDGSDIDYPANYYFKVEPLKWRILSESNGQALIFCEKIIDFMIYTISPFYEEQNNYKTSDVRAFLNGEFYRNAFTSNQKRLVALTEVDNSVASTGETTNKYVCEDTSDRVFPLSVAELSSTDYFASATDRVRYCSDYVLARGAWVNEPTQAFDYFTRSPSDKAPQTVMAVMDDGTFYNALVNKDTPSREDWLGVVPALTINFDSVGSYDYSTLDSGIYNNGTLKAYGTMYGKVVSPGTVYVEADTQYYWTPFDLQETGTIVIENYSGNVAKFIIQVSSARSSGVIATFSGSTATPVLSHFIIEGVNTNSQEIKLEQNSSGVYEIKLYAKNVELTKSFTNSIENFSSLTKLQFLGVAPSGYSLDNTLSNDVKIYINDNDETDVAIVYEYGTMIAPADCSSWFTISTLKSVSFDNLSFSKTVNVSSLFENCPNLSAVSGLYFDKTVNTSRMFYGCSSLISSSINAMSNNISYMYYNCSSLTSAGYLNTYNVTDMSYAFYNCSSLTGVGITYWKTINVTTMAYMFYGCSALKSLDLSGFNTENVTNMDAMFSLCRSLTGLDLSSFNTANVTSMNGMFQSASSLADINFGDNFNTVNVTSMIRMFQSCTSLKYLDLSSFDMTNVTSAPSMLAFGSTNQIAVLKTPYNNGSNISISTGATLTEDGVIVASVPANTKKSRTYVCSANQIEFPQLWLDQINSTTYMTYVVDISEITTIKFLSGSFTKLNLRGTLSTGISVYRPNKTTLVFYYPYKIIRAPQISSDLFCELTSVKEIVFENFDTSQVTEMSCMFSDCPALTTLDLSSFDTSNVEYMAGMFENDTALETLNISSFDTSNVIDMLAMFKNCKKLRNIDLSSFDTSNVADMSYMFYYMSSLSELDVSTFNTSNVTNMSYMFCHNGAKTLVGLNSFDTYSVRNFEEMFSYSEFTSIDVSEFDTFSATNMKSMFSSVSATSLDLSDFYTANVINMAYMFSGFNGYSLDLSSFDTSKVTDMSYMFSMCRVDTLNISSFNTSSVKDMHFMFWLAYNLRSLSLPSSFDTSKVIDMRFMFAGCQSLMSVNVSNFDTSNVIKMNDMFSNCGALIVIDVSGFNTSKVTDMSGMFYGCSNVRELNVSSFNTTNVTDMSEMFAGCGNIKTLSLTNFNVDKVTDVGSMFSNCTSLTTLDLSSFNLKNRSVTVSSMLSLGTGNNIQTLKTPYNNASAISITTGSTLYCNGSVVTNVPAGTTASLTYVASGTNTSFIQKNYEGVQLSKFEVVVETNNDLFSEDKRKNLIVAILEDKENGKLKTKDKLEI